jgi:pimeloyl-ACP methyl ester carboxylesterase
VTKERREIAGPEGRTLEVEISGPDRGHVVVFHSGTPDSGSVFAPLIELGAERGMRHVAYSRPGYGRSDRRTGRSVADCATDVAAILDALSVERAFMVGQSGGGPHALACAALLPERTVATATLGGVAPRYADGLDWYAGMGEENVDEFGAAESGDEELRTWMTTHGAGLSDVTGPALLASLGDLVSAPDGAALTGEYGDHLATSMSHGLSAGTWGWFDDDLAFVADWGFELDEISRPVTIWQGGEDRFVPFAHGEWLARHVPGARAELREGDGHLSIVIGSYGEVLDGLLATSS